jgi:release factor glutamine methyltransferase
LLGGEDGLDFIRLLARQAHRYLCPGGWLALEVGAGQAPAVMELLADAGAYHPPAALPDYQGILRVVRAQRLD